MIVSYTHNFIFVKTHKTASTTCQYIFGECCEAGDIVTPINPPFIVRQDRFKARNWETWEPHLSSKKIRERIGKEQWDSMFKFCFERNPWAKVVSWWMYRRRNGKIQKDFTAWLRHAYDLGKIGPPRLPWDWGHYTIDDVMVVDFIGRYEHLIQDLKTIYERIQVPFPKDMPHFRKNNYDQDYRKFYKPDTRDKVAEIFHREIERFGYEF